jgi:CBS domain-containing protein
MPVAGLCSGMQVRDIMSTDVVTVGVDATVGDAVDRLLDSGVGSVIVVEDGTPAGIVTESDALRVARETGKPLSEIGVGEVGHAPVVTTDPSRSVASVARTMTAEGVKKIPVLDGLDLVGIVTMTDVVWRLPELRQEASDIATLREEWSPD